MTDAKASKPTSKFTIPIGEALKDLDGGKLTEPILDAAGRPKQILDEDGKPSGAFHTQIVTLGLVLSSAMNSETKADGVTLDVLDRLTLAKRFRSGGKTCEIKVSTCEQVKKLVAAHFNRSPLLAGQALLLLGAEPNEDL